MNNTRKLLAGLAAITPLLLTSLTAAQAHDGVKHPKKATTKGHVHGKSDKPHAVKSKGKKSGGKMSGMKMGGGTKSGGNMSGMKMPGGKM